VGRDGRYIELILVSEKPKYFCERDWTGQISLIAFTKSDFWRRGYVLILPGKKRKMPCKWAEQSDH
jgi:hypothetical protein